MLIYTFSIYSIKDLIRAHKHKHLSGIQSQHIQCFIKHNLLIRYRHFLMNSIITLCHTRFSSDNKCRLITQTHTAKWQRNEEIMNRIKNQVKNNLQKVNDDLGNAHGYEVRSHRDQLKWAAFAGCKTICLNASWDERASKRPKRVHKLQVHRTRKNCMSINRFLQGWR